MVKYLMETKSIFPNYNLAELHAHLGTSIAPATYWQIAQERGFILPRRDYHEFVKYVMISPENPVPLNTYFEKVYHSLLDKLSSGTMEVEKATYETFSGAYRSNQVNLLELRNNPMKHNHSAEVDLDQLIMAMVRGMEKALMAYPKMSGGLIFCIAREFSPEQNKIIIQKAIKYHKRGVVGIDIAGPFTDSFNLEDYVEAFGAAKAAGLKLTAHCGEHRQDCEFMWQAINLLPLDRIGHGIYAAYDEAMMEELIRRDIVLEVCPLSNLATQAVENVEQMRFIIRTLIERGVKFTISTDWPEMIVGNRLKEQFRWLWENEIMTEKELIKCNDLAFERSFVRGMGIEVYL